MNVYSDYTDRQSKEDTIVWHQNKSLAVWPTDISLLEETAGNWV